MLKSVEVNHLALYVSLQLGTILTGTLVAFLTLAGALSEATALSQISLLFSRSMTAPSATVITPVRASMVNRYACSPERL